MHILLQKGDLVRVKADNKLAEEIEEAKTEMNICKDAGDYEMAWIFKDKVMFLRKLRPGDMLIVCETQETDDLTVVAVSRVGPNSACFHVNYTDVEFVGDANETDT